MSKNEDSDLKLKATQKRGVIYRMYSPDEKIEGGIRIASIDAKAHTAEFIIATEAPVKDDYFGPPRVLSMKGVILKEYRRNPVILAQHQHHPLNVVGTSLKIYPEADKLIALAKFDVDDEFSARVWGKIERGFLKAASVGFIPKRERLIPEGETDKAMGLVGPVKFTTQWNLFEWSTVAVGADSESLGRSEDPGAVEVAGDDREGAEKGFNLPPLTRVHLKLF